MRALGKGAEAYVYEEEFLGFDVVVKDRKRKTYRNQRLDRRLRRERTRMEVSALIKAREAGVNVPAVLYHDDTHIILEKVEGERLDKVEWGEYMEECGRILAALHKNGICHGDFSITNLILSGKKIFVIDFGLVEFSTYYEKKAEDIRVFAESVRDEGALKEFLRAYREAYKEGDRVIKRYGEMLQRGRYRDRSKL